MTDRDERGAHRRKPGRPAKPMYPAEPAPAPERAADVCADGALSLGDAAAFLGISLSLLKEIVYTRGDLDLVYEGRKPRVLKRQLVARLEAQLEATRARRAG